GCRASQAVLVRRCARRLRLLLHGDRALGPLAHAARQRDAEHPPVLRAHGGASLGDEGDATRGDSSLRDRLMQTQLADWIRDTPAGAEADSILRKCVHCGFCLATCPTYNLLGDELDSPRGRIYLMKQMLEGAPVTRRTQLHLDRCLTCRACETTCPS